jgi:hypothetical protein
MDMQHARIRSILGKKCKITPDNHRLYYLYLKKSLALPCRLTGKTDFPWETDALAEGCESRAYKEMHKSHPSFMDQFDLLELLPPSARCSSIVAKVQRANDQKPFEIALFRLECLDFKEKNYQLIDDYASWVADY